MGSFDSVIVSCPKCSSKVEVQSKAGECRLKRYGEKSVPYVIAEALDGTSVRCPSCSTDFELKNSNPNVRVSLLTVPSLPTEEFD
jgi:DNA-directed RNA polymerase subunit RPC12/RpoP